jgi:peptidoglycan/xylan/chitin deacetylase (PgdA/CDA1 family)
MNRLRGARIAIAITLWLPTGVAAAEDAGPVTAITFDDLPFGGNESLEHGADLLARLAATMKAHKIPAVGFVNEGKLYVKDEVDARIATLRAWLEEGQDLGNHTFSHISVKTSPRSAYEDDVIRGETVTRMLLAERGGTLRYFRHPFLWTGPTDEYREGLATFLSGRRYTVAPVTFDTQDYLFAGVYADAVHRGDEALARRVAEAYLAYYEENVSYFEDLALAVLGRRVRHVMLLHANKLNADLAEKLVQSLKQRGYGFVTLDEALADPAYRRPEPTHTGGMSWLHRWRIVDGTTFRAEPRAPDWIEVAAAALRRNR